MFYRRTMNEMAQVLLPVHILAGTIALLCAALAVSSEKGKKLHVLSGRTYIWCMVAIFLTAIPMSIISSNIFLFLIAVFSFYLAFSGMRFATNRKNSETLNQYAWRHDSGNYRCFGC